MTFSVHLVDLTDAMSRIDLYADCLRLRRMVFISQMGWNLQEYAGCEFDQYDIPSSVHFAVVAHNRLVGCMRLQRTDTNHNNTTYMILDAHRGHIPNLPANIMDAELISDKVWEASRMAICPDIPPKDRNTVLVLLLRAAQNHVAKAGGNTILGMMNPVFERVFRRAGFQVRLFGRIASQRDGPICVLRLDFGSDKANLEQKDDPRLSTSAVA